jgi:chromosome partitioning protein
MKPKIIAVMNYKGGCTKTSTVCGLGAALAREGHRTLLIDLDPQSHVGLHFGINEGEINFSIDDTLIKNGEPIQKVVIGTGEDNLFIAPSRRYLVNARRKMEGRMRRESLLSRVIDPIARDFQYIIIDTPPDEGILTINALYASEYIIIPTPLDAFSLTGINPLMDSFYAMLEAYPERRLVNLGVLINRFDRRTQKQNIVSEAEVFKAFEDKVFTTRIRVDEAVRRAQEAGQSIFEYASESKAAQDYIALAKELAERV